MYERCDHVAMKTWLGLWSPSTEAMITPLKKQKSFRNQVVPVQLVPFFYKISGFGMSWTGTSWFFFFSRVIIASVEGDHIPSQVFIASWSTLFIHEILCMKMIIAMNCCCSCMIFWIMDMKNCWSWMISTDRCIISWPLAYLLTPLPLQWYCHLWTAP